MNSITKDLWSGTLTVEEGEWQLRFTIESKSSGRDVVSVDFKKEDIKEFASELLGLAYGTRNILPSQHQIGDAVWLALWGKSLIAEVHAVHFTKSKVKYDLNLLASGGDTTRVYNIDSCFVIKKLGEDNNS